MSKKLYSMYGTATDAQGQKHIVTVVGEFESTKEEVVRNEDVIIDVTPKKAVDGKLTYTVKKPIRKLTYAYSICHPSDTFNEQTGIDIAKSRLKDNPMGVLTSPYVTCLCKDQIELILFGELKFIMNNIDRFLDKLTQNKAD